MANDHGPEQETAEMNHLENPNRTARFAAIFCILAGLAFGEIYTLNQVGSIRKTFEAQQVKMAKAISAPLSDRVDAMERSNTQQIEEVKKELNAAAKRMGSTGIQFGRARAMVTKLQEEQSRQAESLKRELAAKADQQQVLALTQDVSSTKTDLDTTKKTVDSLTKGLGMARSELGTLIATNHKEIEELRRLGERDYVEFTLERQRAQRVGGVGLALKKTNVRRHRFTLTLVADDLEIEKKDRTVNEPIFFYLAGTKKPYELVVNKVESNQVVGYISTPKGAGQQMASRSEGAR